MSTEQKIAPENIQIKGVDAAPIKTSGAEHVAPELLLQQAEIARVCLVSVDASKTHGTCGDERERVGLRDGSNLVEPRPSVFGGPNIYALGIAELTGYFGDKDSSSGEDRLRRVTGLIESAGIRSGGHEGCAANAGFGVWMRTIAEQPEAIKAYVRRQKGDAYNDDAMSSVIDGAKALVESGRYENWSEDVLPRVLEQDAGSAIERLANVPHEGKTLIRNRIPDKTIDQTELYLRSVVGKGSFVHDDPYADKIEQIIAAGPESAHKKIVAEHAREAILAAVAAAVPNREIYQLDLMLAA